MNVDPALSMKEHTRNRRVTPVILNFDTRWTWVVHFRLRLFYLAKKRRYPLKSLIIDLGSNYLKAPSKFRVPFGWHETSSIPRTQTIRRQLTQFSRRGDLAPGNCAPLSLLFTSGTRTGTFRNPAIYCTYLSYSHAVNYSAKRETNTES